ncbi:hypothetical protein FGO68_gene17429 [Halteria grandinella]|uniref:Uncharacterized protein n=1 Tax=Halteria grandinella TaxID=5974 RepID=A0A8J8NWL8_HALGN|nr:hypothetical protein FGO68_gene17429 [Halteria grandinella]
MNRYQYRSMLTHSVSFKKIQWIWVYIQAQSMKKAKMKIRFIAISEVGSLLLYRVITKVKQKKKKMSKPSLLLTRQVFYMKKSKYRQFKT